MSVGHKVISEVLIYYPSSGVEKVDISKFDKIEENTSFGLFSLDFYKDNKVVRRVYNMPCNIKYLWIAD